MRHAIQRCLAVAVLAIGTFLGVVRAPAEAAAIQPTATVQSVQYYGPGPGYYRGPPPRYYGRPGYYGPGPGYYRGGPRFYGRGPHGRGPGFYGRPHGGRYYR